MPPALILSQDQTLMLNLLFLTEARSNCLTRSPVDLALALSYLVLLDGSSASALARVAGCHLLTLDGRSNLPLLALSSSRPVDRITLSACTLYLVFKEPEAQPDSTASLHRSAAL
jgi:hypothetical protein